jgi:hypothetical protein
MRALVALLPACWTAPPVPEPPKPEPPKPRLQETLVVDAPTPMFMLQLDATHLYWIGGEEGEEGIWRAEKRPYAAPIRIAETVDANGLMLIGDRLWWGDEHGVRSMPKAGGAVVTVVDIAPKDVYDIAIHGQDLYAASYDDNNGTTEIRKYSLDGKRLVETREIDGVSPIVIAREEGVYVGNDLGLVRLGPRGRIDKLSEDEIEVQSIFIDRDDVVFGTPGAVNRAPRRSTTRATQLAEVEGPTSDVTADDRFVYWGSTLDEGSAIWRVPKRGGRARTFVRMDGEPGSVIVDGDHLYWTDTANGKVVRRRREAPDYER